MSEAISVLVVDDDEESRTLLTAVLDSLGYRIEEAGSGAQALSRLVGPAAMDRRQPDVIILDVLMPDIDGLETLKRYRAAGGRKPVVMLSGIEKEAPTVMQAMRLGAQEYVTKPINPDEVREILERVAGEASTRVGASDSPARATPTAGGTIACSPAMQRVRDLISRIADVDVPILITGESGVGKDVAARDIHARSTRKDKPFVKLNCAAVPTELWESELFGHERGSFTGAHRTAQGKFEQADGGTLFLDEIGEMPVSLQAKLLQALQDGEFYHVGGSRKIKVDVRVVVATNRNLERSIREGTFREDLYYRLNVVHFEIPPLRERREDIPALLDHFVDKYGKRYGRSVDMTPPIMQRFLSYDWPGNIRELENLVRRLMVLRDPSYVLSEMRDRAAPAQSVSPSSSPPSGPHGGGHGPGHYGPPPQLAMPPSHGQPSPGHSPMSGAGAGSPHGPMSHAPQHPQPMQHVGATLPGVPPMSAAMTTQMNGLALAMQNHNAMGSMGHGPPPIPTQLPAVIPPSTVTIVGNELRIDLKEVGRQAAHIAEREAIVTMLGHTGGNKREAAERLGISYKAILYKIREFGIGRPRVPRRLPRPGELQVLEGPADATFLADDAPEAIVEGEADGAIDVIDGALSSDAVALGGDEAAYDAEPRFADVP